MKILKYNIKLQCSDLFKFVEEIFFPKTKIVPETKEEKIKKNEDEINKLLSNIKEEKTNETNNKHQLTFLINHDTKKMHEMRIKVWELSKEGYKLLENSKIDDIQEKKLLFKKYKIKSEIQILLFVKNKNDWIFKIPLINMQFNYQNDDNELINNLIMLYKDYLNTIDKLFELENTKTLEDRNKFDIKKEKYELILLILSNLKEEINNKQENSTSHTTIDKYIDDKEILKNKIDKIYNILFKLITYKECEEIFFVWIYYINILIYVCEIYKKFNYEITYVNSNLVNIETFKNKINKEDLDYYDQLNIINSADAKIFFKNCILIEMYKTIVKAVQLLLKVRLLNDMLPELEIIDLYYTMKINDLKIQNINLRRSNKIILDNDLDSYKSLVNDNIETAKKLESIYSNMSDNQDDQIYKYFYKMKATSISIKINFYLLLINNTDNHDRQQENELNIETIKECQNICKDIQFIISKLENTKYKNNLLFFKIELLKYQDLTLKYEIDRNSDNIITYISNIYQNFYNNPDDEQNKIEEKDITIMFNDIFDQYNNRITIHRSLIKNIPKIFIDMLNSYNHNIRIFTNSMNNCTEFANEYQNFNNRTNFKSFQSYNLSPIRDSHDKSFYYYDDDFYTDDQEPDNENNENNSHEDNEDNQEQDYSYQESQTIDTYNKNDQTPPSFNMTAYFQYSDVDVSNIDPIPKNNPNEGNEHTSFDLNLYLEKNNTKQENEDITANKSYIKINDNYEDIEYRAYLNEQKTIHKSILLNISKEMQEILKNPIFKMIQKDEKGNYHDDF